MPWSQILTLNNDKERIRYYPFLCVCEHIAKQRVKFGEI